VADVLLAITLGVAGWLAASFLGKPLLTFLDLRQAVERARIHAIRTPVPIQQLIATDWDDGVLSGSIKSPEMVAISAAKEELRRCATDMLAFGRSAPAAKLLKRIGYDAVAIGEAAHALANVLTDGMLPRTKIDDRLRRALKT